MAWLRSEVRARIKPERAIAQESETTKPLAPVGPPKGNKNATKVEETESPPDAKPQRNEPVVNRVVSPVQYGSTNAEYLTARIARDNPQVFGRMKAGEFRSVRQAGIAAGIVKPTIQVPADPLAAGRRLARHFTPEQFADLARAFQEALGRDDDS
jgi:hypothetical protein